MWQFGHTWRGRNDSFVALLKQVSLNHEDTKIDEGISLANRRDGYLSIKL
jgi:hypothetical protein